MNQYEMNHSISSGTLKEENLFITLEEHKVAELQYFWSQDTNTWMLDDILVDQSLRRQGLATNLLQEFVRRVGPGQAVNAPLVNVPSLEVLRRYEELLKEESYLEIPGSELDNLPIKKLLDKSGIRLDQVSMYYVTELFRDYPYHMDVFFNGTTLPLEPEL